MAQIKKLSITLILTLLATPMASDWPPRFVVWNVGQGQWLTQVSTPDQCLHFDQGGEVKPQREVAKLCGQNQNRLFFSHWDLDHTGFVGWVRKNLSQVCLALPPGGQATFQRRHRLRNLANCEPTEIGPKQIFSGFETLLKTSNDQSHVLLTHRILIPGDASRASEKLWRARMRGESARILILGHHGSRTSTSQGLLNQLPHLQMAVASARKAKYGHPHGEVVERLRRKGIPVLVTEDWGHIAFQISTKALAVDTPWPNPVPQARRPRNHRRH